MIYFLTCAVERTPVHAELWHNMIEYAKLLRATILVKGCTYKNRNNPYEADPVNAAWWAPEVEPYLSDSRERLNSNAMWAGDVRIRPTATDPLSGMQTYGQHSTVIFPHTRQHLRSYPAANSDYAKMQWTTGAVTVPNYSDTKVGVKAIDNHVHGFVIVEVEDDAIFHVRNINARSSDGTFVDSARGLQVAGGKVSDALPAQCLRIGDSHAHEQYEPVVAAVEQIRDLVEPARIVMDDVYSHSVAGHRLERDNWRHGLTKSFEAKTVLSELIEAMELLDRLGCTDVMHSNHHVQLDEWLDNVDGRHDPSNVRIWAQLVDKVAAWSGHCPAFVLFGEEYFQHHDVKPKFWRRGERCVIGDVRHDHGHEGFSGARGAQSTWHKAGCKMTTAHTHQSYIRDGHFQVGHTSDPKQHHYADETKSAWAWSVCVQDALGKRQLIHIVEGRWLSDE